MKTKFKRMISVLLLIAMTVSLVPGAVLPAAAEETSAVSSNMAPEGYNAAGGQAPVLYADGSGKDVLLIQTNMPWSTDSNAQVLSILKSRGYLKGYTVTTVANALKLNFADYSVIIYANDQSAESYSQYSRIRASLEQYIYNGGTVLFGACDNGWAEGQIVSSLPGGVTKFEDFSEFNYIVDTDHPIVTGELTGSSAMTNGMLYSTYCSHTSFHERSLPAGSNVILRSEATGAPTLVEYPFGNGWVVLSGLTWEFGYCDEYSGEYSKKFFDDYMAYGLHASGVEREDPRESKAVSFTYSPNTVNQELAKTCVLYSLLAYRESTKNKNGVWVMGTDKTALGLQLHADKYEDLYSYNYAGKKGDHITVKEENPGTHSILYTIGHRPVKDAYGNVTEQLLVVFRGTNDQEWYGNFDLTGTSYTDLDYHKSFQTAVDNAMEDLGNYIREMTKAGKMYTQDLKILLTGHSRGAGVANMMAHELTDIADGITSGRNYSDFSGIDIGDVYAYTFATPNVASYTKIKSSTDYKNINNFCFTDDFVPNLPLESWSWGKYGRTYWATAAKLKDNDTFYDAVVTYFGEKPSYKASYTNNITKGMTEATHINSWTPIRHYYDYKFMYGMFNNTTLYSFIRTNLAGAMQKGNKDAQSDAKANLVKTAFNIFTTAAAVQELAYNLVMGSSSDFVDVHVNDNPLAIDFPSFDFKLNGPLNYAHQCGSYYNAIRLCYSSFKYNALTSGGYSATTYSAGTETADCDADQVAALKEFLAITSTNEENAVVTNAELLGWDAEDVSTWAGVAWTNGSVTGLDMAYSGVTGTLDLTAFPDLTSLDVHYCGLTGLNVSGCAKLTELLCSGNSLTALDLTGLDGLTVLECANNHLTALDLSDCTALTHLDCSGNLLTELNLSACAGLTWLICASNYLDPNDTALNALVDTLNAGEETYAEFLPQMKAENAVFDAEDTAVLKAIAQQNGNNTVLLWDLEDPASWNRVQWIPVGGTYRLEGVDFSGLGLTGSADFSGCDHLEYLLLSDNGFTELKAAGCTTLKTLWCEHNYLDEDAAAALALTLAADNFKGEPQYSDKELNARDVAALDSFADAQDLDWEPEFYANNDNLTWELSEEGIYILTGIDCTGSTVAGTLDLTGFAHLTDVKCMYSEITALLLPETVTAIGTDAFRGNEQLLTVTLPESVTEIGTSAFADCISLRTMVIPASVAGIGDHAFDGCEDLTLVSFLGKAPALGEDAFANCRENLTLSLRLSEDTITVKYGQQHTLTAENFPDGARITWGTSMESVATVDNGTVTAVEPGAALITAVSDDGFTATCVVMVPEHEFTETVNNGDGTHTRICSGCGYRTTDDHEYYMPLDNGDGTHTSYCGYCDDALTEPHDLNSNFCICGAMNEFLERLKGKNRCETAWAVATEMKELMGLERFDCVVIASGTNFADALAGSYLASERMGPILLHTEGMEEENVEFIRENLWEGGLIYILGGTAAVPESIENMLSDDYYVVRLKGKSRYETNLEILREADIYGREILIATGLNFADSLSASATGLPVLMVDNKSGTLTEDQIQFLQEYAYVDYTIIGGTGAVSQQMEDAIEAVLEKEVERVYGKTREDTSVLVAERYFGYPQCVLLAYSQNFPDGLCGGPLAYYLGAPLILTAPGRETVAAAYVKENDVVSGYVLGGTAAVSDRTVQLVFQGE